MKKQLLHIVLACFLGGTVQAQLIPNLGGQRAGLSSLSFLKNDMNPRSLSMSGASVALSSDEFAVISNPAGVADMRSLSIGTSNYFVGAGVNQALISVGMPITSISSLALSINSLNSGEMEVRTEFQPDGTGQKVFANNMAIGATYAMRLSDMFSAGITLKYIYEQLAEYKNHTAAFDLGFSYNTDWKDLSFAVMIQNFSGNSNLQGDYLEVDFNRNEITIGDATTPTVFRMGASMTALKKDRHQLTVAFELDHPNDNAENFRFGAEYSYLELLYFRAGMKLNVKGQGLPSFGIGIRHRIGGHPIHFNYGVLPTNYMGVQHLVGLSFSINNEISGNE